MMQQPFGEPDDSDINRADDGRLSLASQDEFRAAPANVQRQYIGRSLRKAGTNAEHGSSRFCFAGENFDIEAGLGFDSIHKLLSILRVTNGACRHGRSRLHVIGVDDSAPFLKALSHAIHGLWLQSFRLIDPFAEPKNPSL
jgi:hypothetical protein